MSDLLRLLEREAVPAEETSRWYCDRPACDGQPHGPSWHWCAHPEGRHPDHAPECRHARSAQRPPDDGDWFVWLLISGRGFGKSRCAAEWLIDRALHAPPAEWAVVARTADDVRKNARDFRAGLTHVFGAGALDDGTGYGCHIRQYNRHENDIYLDNGAVIHCLSADKPDKLRGYNLAGAWADELASWTSPESWDMLLMALREGSHTQVVVTTTPKPTALIRALTEKATKTDRRSYRLTTGSMFDNADNLAQNFVTDMRAAYEGTRLGRQELHGELLEDVAGALVSWQDIHSARMGPEDLDPKGRGITRNGELVAFTRIVVAVDPAATYDPEKKSDETGIVVCAKGRDGHGYVLGDYSCKKSPKEWAKTAVMAFEKHGADRIVAEKNQGHGMVEEIIRSVAPYVPYTAVMAKDSKRLRAEPITALYEQGRIHHVGEFKALEDQLITWEPDSKMKSPDRMDALVHGMTELGLAKLGSIDVFRAFIERDGARKATKEPAERRDLGRRLARAGGGVELARRRQQARCKHRIRYGGTGCVFCGKDPA